MPKKQRSGVVVSDKMDKTIVVQIERTVSHRLYGKKLRRRKRYKAHDETNVCRLGDQVLIEEARPLSKQKHWRVVRILERHEVADVQPREIDAEMAGVRRSERDKTAVPEAVGGTATAAALAASDQPVPDPAPADQPAADAPAAPEEPAS